MHNVVKQLKMIREQITAAEKQFHRAPGSVQLIAVSKTQPVSVILQAINAGQRVFAENYVQEAIPKIMALSQHNLEWHFIGNIQTNKTKLIAENFAWVQSVSRLKIAERLNEQRPQQLPVLNICLEVKLSSEVTKSGIAIEELLPLASAVQGLPRLKLRGLMTMLPAQTSVAEQHAMFHQLAELQQLLSAKNILTDTLSMGMSSDFVSAIAEGSTLVRIGAGIFGERN